MSFLKKSGNKPSHRNPWAWIPTLYFAEGIPYIIVMTLSVIMYKRMGISNADIALYTSWLYLPWVIKPLWSPLVDILRTKRFWIVLMQLFIGAGLAGVAFTIPVPNFFQYTLAFFWLLAFSSATHDIAADGFYMLGLSQGDQSFFVGIRSTFYRFAMLTGQGLIVILAGYFESTTGLETKHLQVETLPKTQKTQLFSPDSLKLEQNAENQAIISLSEIQIGTEKINTPKADSVLAAARQWNLEHGFYTIEEKTETPKKQQSWWQQHVSMPLAGFLRKHFNAPVAEVKTEKTGNIALAYFYLAKKPEKEQIVMNFGWERGDQSIKLVEGTRFTFDSTNWNKPALAVFQIDPKLEKPVVAHFAARSGNIPLAWTISFAILAGLFMLFFVYHRFVLPYPASDKPASRHGAHLLKDFFATFASFFKKQRIGLILGVLLLYRLGESQLVKLASPFLLDAREVGGLGITTGDLGIIYGTVGMIALTLGGILGGILASRNGLKYWLWWMVLAMNLPNLVYVYLSYAMPESLITISSFVAIEQFGYGFGFTAYMLYMIFVSEGEHKTAHFAICTGFMALGMMLPGMISGWLQEIIGYQNFFIWVMLCTIPIFLILPFLKIDPKFGKKNKEKD